MQERRWYRGELARALRVSTATIGNRIKAGTLPPPQYDSLRRVHYWPDAVVKELLESEPLVETKEAREEHQRLVQLFREALADALRELREGK